MQPPEDIVKRDEALRVKTNGRKVAVNVLRNMGVHRPAKYVNKLKAKDIDAITNFVVVCDWNNLPYEWEPLQIIAYMNRLHKAYYVEMTLRRHWKTLEDLGTYLGKEPMDEAIALFDWVLANAKESKDDKVPVSKRLLIELCEATEKVLVGYDQILAKVMFLAAWGAYMRVLEYSKTKSKQDHNLCHDSVQVCDDDLCVEFLSDKTMKKSEPPRHRLI